MKYKKVVVKYINFTDIKEANATKNYPHNGLFVVKVDNGEVVHSELRFIDKSMPTSVFVAPESVFNGFIYETKDYPEENELVAKIEEKTYQGQTDNGFILEFSKILLNSKK